MHGRVGEEGGRKKMRLVEMLVGAGEGRKEEGDVK